MIKNKIKFFIFVLFAFFAGNARVCFAECDRWTDEEVCLEETGGRCVKSQKTRVYEGCGTTITTTTHNYDTNWRSEDDISYDAAGNLVNKRGATYLDDKLQSEYITPAEGNKSYSTYYFSDGGKDVNVTTQSGTPGTYTVESTSYDASGKVKDVQTMQYVDGKQIGAVIKGRDGSTAYIDADKNVFKVDAQGNATSGAVKGCQPLPMKYAEMSSCVLCPIFEIVLKTDQHMANLGPHVLGKGFRNVLVLIMALFIAYKTLILVSSWTRQDIGKYLYEILVQSLKVLIAALLLAYPSAVFHYVINPLFTAALDFGMAVVDDDAYQGMLSMRSAYEPLMPDGLISKKLLASVMASVKMFGISAAKLPTIGSSLLCISINAAAEFLFDFTMFVEGLFCWGFGWAIAIACGFYLVDSVVRFGIFCTILPFIIAAAPFKALKKYALKGWNIFVNCAFHFMMMGVVLSVSSTLIGEALVGENGNLNSQKSGIEQIEDAINGDSVSVLKDLMGLSGKKFLILLACCIFALKIIKQVGQLVEHISSTSGGTPIAAQMGGQAMQIAKKAGQMALKAGGAVLGGGVRTVKRLAKGGGGAGGGFGGGAGGKKA